MATKSTCGGCGQVFASIAAFDTHRTGSFGEPIYRSSQNGHSQHVCGYTAHTRRCLSEEEMQAKGMSRNERGWWMLPALLKGEEVEMLNERSGGGKK